MKRNFAIIYDKIHNEGSPGGGGSDGKMDDGQAPSAVAPLFEDAGADIETDDFGYPISKPVEGEKKQEAPPAQEPKQEKPASDGIKSTTGYEEDVVIPEEKPPEPVVEKPASVQEKLGYELEFGEMDKATADKAADFAKANGLTKEAAQAFVNLKNSEISAQKKSDDDKREQFEKTVLKLKSDWQKELKSDPVFGGEKYAASVKNVDKVLTDFLPGIKNVLTEGNRMLPPVVMKDLAKLADHLYASERIVQGDPPGKADEGSDDPLDFYNN